MITFNHLFQTRHARQLGSHSETDRHVLVHRAHTSPSGAPDPGVPHLPAALRPHQRVRPQPEQRGVHGQGHARRDHQVPG